MPLLQGIIQILIEHSEKFWGIGDKDTRKDRPVSVYFVGTDIASMLASEASPQELELFRSIARNTGFDKVKQPESVYRVPSYEEISSISCAEAPQDPVPIDQVQVRDCFRKNPSLDKVDINKEGPPYKSRKRKRKRT